MKLCNSHTLNMLQAKIFANRFYTTLQSIWSANIKILFTQNTFQKKFFQVLFIYKKVVFLHPQKNTDYYPLG